MKKMTQGWVVYGGKRHAEPQREMFSRSYGTMYLNVRANGLTNDCHYMRAFLCHLVEMINCEKVRLPRQICNFCVSAVSRMESRFFVSRKCFFPHLPFQAAGLLGLRFRAPNSRYHWQSSHNTRVPTGVGRTFELLIGRSKGLSNKNPK